MAYVKVRELLEDVQYKMNLRLAVGEEGLGRIIKNRHVQKPGLALTGYTKFVISSRVQVFGKTEIFYLKTLGAKQKREVLAKYFDCKPACCVVTRKLRVPKAFKEEAERTGTPVMTTDLSTPLLISRVTRFLESLFAETTSAHGVLMDVFGVGILILGRAGIGKSELALDLILRGHRLVADDIVDMIRIPPGNIYGSGSELIKNHMEIRGLGIINIKEMFGISAIRDRKKVQLVVQMMDWEEGVEYDRIGLDESKYDVLGVDLPHLVLAVRPGRYLTPIIEVAARNYLLKTDGYHAAQEFQKNLLRQIQINKPLKIVGEEVE